MEGLHLTVKEIKPVLTEYVRESHSLIKSSATPDEKTIHDIRILLKKSRASLKLAAPQINKASFDLNLLAFRNAGRLLSSWRDSSVHRKSLKELRKEYPRIFAKLKKHEKIASLLGKNEKLNNPPDEMKPILEKIDELLRKAAFRIRFLRFENTEQEIMLNQLKLTYSKVSAIYLKCRNSPRPDDVHQFRKKTKDFLYQLFFFRQSNPSMIKSLEKNLEIMTGNLGKYNDLTQLIKTLEFNANDPANLTSMNLLIIKIREKQDRYLSKVWPSAFKIFGPGTEMSDIMGIGSLPDNKNL